MIVVFFIMAFLFQRKNEDANYSALIWLPPYINRNAGITCINIYIKMKSIRTIFTFLLSENTWIRIKETGRVARGRREKKI